MPLPGININLGNGQLGRTAASSDGVAGLILTGTAVADKLLLGKVYQLSSTRDLTTLGITTANNLLIDKEVKAFYGQAGEGAELYLMVVSNATTLEAMCAPGAESPLSKLMEATGGRLRLVGINKIAPAEYTAALTQGIDDDAIKAAAAAHQNLESQAKRIRPARILIPACGWNGEMEDLFKPREASYNRVMYVLASDDQVGKSAAIGQVLGRAASIEPHQSVGRVKSGSIATQGYFTNGKSYLEMAHLADSLNDAGYVFYIKYPTKNGCYLNGDAMAAPFTDDYSELFYGRIVDKAMRIIYDTYLSEIRDNVIVDENGLIPQGACSGYESMIDNAIGQLMGGQISDFRARVDPNQNILSTGVINITGTITPQGVINTINFGLAFDNPSLN